MRCLSWRSSGRSSLVRSSGWPTSRICRSFSLVGLEVREEPDLLEGLGVEILGLVEDEHGVLAGALALDQEVLEREEPLGSGTPGLGDAEVLEHVLEDPSKRAGSYR